MPGHERPLSDKVKAVGHHQAHQGHWAEQDEQPNVGGKTKTDECGRNPRLQWVVSQVEAVTERPEHNGGAGFERCYKPSRCPSGGNLGEEGGSDSPHEGVHDRQAVSEE